MATLFDKKKTKPKPRPSAVTYFALLALALLPSCTLFEGRSFRFNPETKEFQYNAGVAAGEVDATIEYTDPTTGAKFKGTWKSATNYDAAQAVQIAQTQIIAQTVGAAVAEAIKRIPVVPVP